jgi:hypothetical protein
MQMRGFGQFTNQPPSIRMRFMKTRNGLNFHFRTPILLEDPVSGKNFPVNVVRPDQVSPPFHTGELLSIMRTATK